MLVFTWFIYIAGIYHTHIGCWDAMTWWLPIFLSSFLVSQLRVPFVHAWFCPQSWPKAIIPSGWQPAIYGTQTGHTQWTLLDLWILNPFSPTGMEPGCSACTIGSCASRSNFGKMVFCNAKSKAKDGLPLHGSSLPLPPLCLAMAFVGLLAPPAWSHCGPPCSSGCPGNLHWPDMAASHIGSLASSWFKAWWSKALEALEIFGPKDMNKTMGCTWVHSGNLKALFAERQSTWCWMWQQEG